jgi:hypothetical protein
MDRLAVMTRHTPLYIVASPQPQVGKTLIARLLIEFFRASGRPLAGFDLNPRQPRLAGYFPRAVWTMDIAATRGQMALFDMLIANDAGIKIIDLGAAAFEQFFRVMREIGFVAEARQRSIEPIVLFIADSAPATARSYAELRHLLAPGALVPMHNEGVAVFFTKKDFPPMPATCGTVRIPRLSPIVRGVVDRPSFSFGTYVKDRPGGPTEIHAWIEDVFTEFRQLELRLLMGKVTASLGGSGGLDVPPAQPVNDPRS